MAGNSSVTWDVDSLSPSLRSAVTSAQGYISKITSYHAMKMMAYAKSNAPWTDRTGNARNTLAAEANNSRSSQNQWEIVIGHGMKYGLWLEVRFAGRFAIIRPTIRAEAQDYWDSCKEVLEHIVRKTGG